MGSALNSIFGGGNILGLLTSVASMFFPPLAIANSLANLLTQAIGQAMTQAINTLVQESGMPKFLGEMIKDMVSQVLGGQTKPSSPEVDQAVGGDQGVQDWMSKFITDLTNQIVESARKFMETSEGKDTKGGGKKATTGSWLEAIAKAMGEIAGDKAAKMVELSQKMADLNGTGKELQAAGEALDPEKDKAASQTNTEKQQQNAREFSQTQSLFQAASQEFSILQNTFANAIKSIGEGLTAMGRKG
jgi:hypothetical protein